MEYTREYWQEREGTKLNKFTKVNETTSTVELVNTPDSITVAGKEVTTARLNNMESGITGAVAGVNEIQGVLDFTTAVNTFSGLSQTSRAWQGMTTQGTDVYACVNGGDIYKQTNGTGDFIALGQTSRAWSGMTTQGTDVYAGVYTGDIYKQTNGTGDFIALGQTSRAWSGMTTQGTDVYACVTGGDIYKQTNGTGDFIALGQESKDWRDMTTQGTDVYACVSNGDIYKQTNGTGDFIALGQESRLWLGMTTQGTDVYAGVYNGDIYKQTGGVGDFIALGQTPRFWQVMTTQGTDVYACVFNGDIYTASILTGNTFRASSSFTLPAMPDGARKRILNTHATTAITVTAYSGTTIEGQATMTLSAGHEVELELIGTDWRRVVLSQSATPEAGKAMVWPENASGTFTPTFSFGGESTGITYSRNIGRWQREGNKVSISISFALTSKGTSTGNLLISGLPVACGANQEDRGGFYFFGLVSSTGYIAGLCSAINSTNITLHTYNTAGVEAVLTDANFSNTAAFRIIGSYFV